MIQKMTKQHNNILKQVGLNDTNFLIIPDAIIAFTQDTVFNTWQSLEQQLSQVDPVRDSGIYHALDDRAAAVFESWLSFRYIGQVA
jgi:hypothetical protein